MPTSSGTATTPRQAGKASKRSGTPSVQADFAPHNIYFVWDCQIDYIADQAIYSNLVQGGVGEEDPNITCVLFNTNRHTNGIDLYFGPDDTWNPDASGGTSDGLPAKALLITGTYRPPSSNAPAPTVISTHTLSHEMGHCLGLFHTHQGTYCDASVPNCGYFLRSCASGIYLGDVATYVGTAECSDGSNGTTAGDCIADTPADPNILDAGNGNPNFDCSNPSQPDLCLPPPGKYQPLTDNIMSYTYPLCASSFTPGQGQRMRNILRLFPAYFQPLFAQPSTAAATVFGPGNHLIQINTEFPGGIVLSSGAQLTIAATVGIGYGKQVVVNRNARLVVDGGTLTRGCGAPNWGGVVVRGNNIQPQPAHDAPLTNNSQAGIVVLDGARIEYANVGIAASAPQAVVALHGGLIHAENSTFFNCQTGVRIEKYAQTNRSFFKDCTFIEVGNARASTNGVTIRSSNGVLFSNCTFENMDTEGILTYDAGIQVVSGNEFTQNRYGITSYTTIPLSGIATTIGTGNTLENQFNNNDYGVYASYSQRQPSNLAQMSYDIINNEFHGGYWGVVMDGASRYAIAGNLFDPGAALTNSNGGVYCLNTGSELQEDQKEVHCNLFQNTDIGIWMVNDNREVQFLKNEFQIASDGVDFLLGSFDPFRPGAIRSEQGSEFTPGPALNCFTDPGFETDIQTLGNTLKFTYWVSKTAPFGCRVNPQTQGYYMREYSNVNAGPGINCEEFGGVPITESDIEEARLQQLRDNLAELELALEADSSLIFDYYTVKEKKDWVLQLLVGRALDSLDYEQAEFLLAGENSLAAKHGIFGVKVRSGDLSGAQAYLDSLPTPTQDEVWFKAVQTINLQLIQANDSLVLDSTQLELLGAVAHSQSPYRGIARAILTLLTGERFEVEHHEPVANRVYLQSGKPITKHEVEFQNGFALYPNPADRQIMLELADGLRGKPAVVEVYNAFGYSVFQKRFAEAPEKLEIATVGMEPGLYFLTISGVPGRRTVTRKFNISR